MATFVDPSQSSEYAICPYNEHHVMKKNRLPYHLVKCAKNYPHLQLMECPYNRKHRISSNQYQKHIEQCAQHNRLSVREDVDAIAAGAKRSVDFMEVVENQALCEWDDSDITSFTRAACESEDITDQLNMDKISFSKPVLTHRQGDSIDEETQVDRKPLTFGIGRGKIFAWSDRNHGSKGVGRSKPKE